jgi:hypothetical protein
LISDPESKIVIPEQETQIRKPKPGTENQQYFT